MISIIINKFLMGLFYILTFKTEKLSRSTTLKSFMYSQKIKLSLP